ncbi:MULTISPECIES: hypothetical protein [Mucilaginibacter]|jgi:hypothetical protein|uniref:HEPN AbiU2-like domain-containing protein n=1 Tax=Mucilaginibacter ginkgonis TaxID=2682091 RepID=A0A6I4I466_9SPHI|nr:hypothetical protein [Mucilaginibacter ginkgonis]QQL50597.1 hypothetical protein GO620_003835 [Mucilaginibacter ginkgonis]
MSQYEGVSDEELPDNFGYTHRSLFFLSVALGEILIISKPHRKKEELDFLNNFIFKKYNVSLLYTFTMEYCKLLESNKGNSNYAGLHKLNRKVAYLKGKSYQKDFESNGERIDKLINSDFYKHLRMLRDKTFAHTDKSKTGNNFNIHAFTDEQLITAKSHFNEMNSIHSVCAKYFKVEFIISLDDDSSDLFVARQGKYLKHYKENTKDDWDVD